jgi:hypothetical protein
MQHRENLHVVHESLALTDPYGSAVPPRLTAHGLHDQEIEEDLAVLRAAAAANAVVALSEGSHAAVEGRAT